MRNAFMTMIACSSLLLGGCATLSGPDLGDELAGRSARLVPERGQPSTLTFGRDGTVTSAFGERVARGHWRVSDRRLCFLWAENFEECWPYTEPFRPGETVAIRSSRGNLVRVTLL